MCLRNFVKSFELIVDKRYLTKFKIQQQSQKSIEMSHKFNDSINSISFQITSSAGRLIIINIIKINFDYYFYGG
jgi:hypothetical protein